MRLLTGCQFCAHLGFIDRVHAVSKLHFAAKEEDLVEINMLEIYLGSGLCIKSSSDLIKEPRHAARIIVFW